jgi:hypothetical protein
MMTLVIVSMSSSKVNESLSRREADVTTVSSSCKCITSQENNRINFI